MSLDPEGSFRRPNGRDLARVSTFACPMLLVSPKPPGVQPGRTFPFCWFDSHWLSDGRLQGSVYRWFVSYEATYPLKSAAKTVELQL